MRSGISFCKKELIVNNLKMYGMLSVLWGVYLFLVYPLYLVNYRYEMDVEKLGMYLFSPAVFIPFLVSLIASVILFHFLKTDNGVAFYMSLPTTKTQIFFSQFLSGLILYLIPLLINFGLMILYCFLKVKEGAEQLPTLLMQWLLFMILLFVVNFFIATAIGMITGSIIWQIIFIAVYFGLPTYFDGACILIGRQLLRGFADQNPWHDFFRSIDIFREIFIDGYWGRQANYWEAVIFLGIYAVIAFVVAYLLYRFKKMESNREWVSFLPIKYVFIVGVTFCMVVLMSAFFSLALFQDENSSLYFYLGAIVGAVLGYIISAMIVWKTVYLKKAWLGVFVAVALTLGIFGAIDIDLFGFERYIPRAEEIESIYFNSDHFALAGTDLYKLITPGDDIGYRNDSYHFKEAENIERMRQIHQHILKDNPENDSELKTRVFGYISVSYYLKDGRAISRRYREVDFINNPFYQELMQSEEIIKKRYVFLDEEQMKKSVMVKVGTENGHTEENFTGKQMQELLTVLQAEVRQTATAPEEMEVRTNGENEIILQKYLPIRIQVLFENPDSKKNRYNHLPRATGERVTENWMANGYNYMFYGQTPKLREWLEHNTKALDVRLEQDKIEKLVFYRLSDYGHIFYRFNEWGYYDWEKELNEAPIAEVTVTGDFDKYLAISGRIIRYNSLNREAVLMLIKMKNGREYARQILPEDYQQIVK